MIIKRKLPKTGTGILSVMAYFRNEASSLNGIGLQLDFVDGEEGRRFSEMCEQALLMMDGVGHPEVAIEYLKHVGKDKSAYDVQLVVATIHWLERRRHIVSDEFNGVVWLGYKDGILMVMRTDEPTPEKKQEIRACHSLGSIELRALETKDFEVQMRSLLGTPRSN